jgi:DNA-binding transcriptional LysR family regulator
MDRLDCDRMLVAVVETGSFSKAADRLGTSSGQASKLVSKLEAGLGVQLLKRTTRALAPTEIGLAYCDHIKALLEDFDALDASVRNTSTTATGRLRLSVPMSFGTMQLTPALVEFAQSFPNIQLDVSFSDRVVSLIDEGFDLAIRIGNPRDSSLIVRKLCDMRVILTAAPGYLASRGEPTSPADLAVHDCIIDTNFREPFNWRFHSRNDSAATSIPVTGRLRFSNAESCLAAAEAGLGITRIPSFLAGQRFRDGLLKPLLTEFEDHPLGVNVIYPPGRHLASKVRLLVDFLAKRYRGEPSWDQGW